MSFGKNGHATPEFSVSFDHARGHGRKNPAAQMKPPVAHLIHLQTVHAPFSTITTISIEFL
jgi:hypothetical protein